tara:strand:+ start:1607 stop:1810 length:204 start_codon:yes stop_codon:yes gene_type:complete
MVISPSLGLGKKEKGASSTLPSDTVMKFGERNGSVTISLKAYFGQLGRVLKKPKRFSGAAKDAKKEV